MTTHPVSSLSRMNLSFSSSTFFDVIVRNTVLRQSTATVRNFFFASWLCCAMLGLALLGLASDQPVQAQESAKAEKTVDFFFDVAPILSKHCYACHNNEDPKGGFKVEDREALASYITPGDLGNSSLWTDYLRADPNAADSLLMPPKSEGGPLSNTELAVIRTWIQEGAELPEVYHLGDSSTHPVQEKPPEATTQTARVWAFIGYFHPAVVHFPVALLLLSGVAAFASFVLGSRAQDLAFYCLAIGALSSIAASVMGWSFATEQGYPGWRVLPADEEGEDFFIHRWLGVAVTVLACLFAVIAYVSRRKQDVRGAAVWRVGAMIVAALVGWVGHEGGELSYPKLYEKAFHRLYGTSEEEEAASISAPPPNFEMRASS